MEPGFEGQPVPLLEPLDEIELATLLAKLERDQLVRVHVVVENYLLARFGITAHCERCPHL